MGQPVTLYSPNGVEIIVYGRAQREVEIGKGALTEKPKAQPKDAPKADTKDAK